MPKFLLGFEAYASTHPEVGQPLTSQFTERLYTSDEDNKLYMITAQFTTTGILRYFQESNEIMFDPGGGGNVGPEPITAVPTIDVSSWQPTSLTDLIGKAKAHHAVIRLYQKTIEGPTLQGHSRAQIASARANAVSISGYSWLYTGVDPARQVNEPFDLAASVGLKIPALYLDIEEYPEDGSLPTADEILAAVDAIRSRGEQPGMYTRRDIWERVGSPELPGVWLWVADWNGQATLDVESFGSMKLVGHQYASQLPSGESLDLSVFSSEATV